MNIAVSLQNSQILLPQLLIGALKPSRITLQRIYSSDNKLTDEAVFACQQLNIDQKDLIMKNLDYFADEPSEELRRLKYQQSEQRREFKINQIQRYILNGNGTSNNTKRNIREKRFQSSFNQLSQTIEERALKSASNWTRQKERAFAFQQAKSASMRPDSAYNYVGSGTEIGIQQHQPIDLSLQIDKTDRVRNKWVKVFENKEKLTVDHQLTLKSRLDILSKKEKQKQKKQLESLEDKKGLITFKHQKYNTVLKKREQLDQEYENKQQMKEQYLNQRMVSTVQKKRQKDDELINSKYYGTSSKMLSSDLNESQFVYKERAKSGHSRLRRHSHQDENEFYQDDEEQMQKKLQYLEQKYRRAEIKKQNKLNESIGKLSMTNEKVKQKQMIKEQYSKQSEYNRLKNMLDHSFSYQKKTMKRVQYIQESAEMKVQNHHAKLEQTKARFNEIQQMNQQRLTSIERREQEKEQVLYNLKMAMASFNSQKKEIKYVKKQEQEFNLKKNRRVQSAYKRILIDKLKEKEERLNTLRLKKQKIQQYKEKNSSNLRNFVQVQTCNIYKNSHQLLNMTSDKQINPEQNDFQTQNTLSGQIF